MSKQVLSKAQFAEFLPKVIDICAQNKLATLSNGIVKSDLLKPANDHLREALKYNLPGGKMTRYIKNTVSIRNCQREISTRIVAA